MTTVTIDLLPNGSVTAFTGEGHADPQKTAGEDVLCAGISVLLQTTAEALKSIAGLHIGEQLDPETGYMTVLLEKKIKRSQRKTADILLQAMRLGLEAIARAYPENLKIVERRCK